MAGDNPQPPFHPLTSTKAGPLEALKRQAVDDDDCASMIQYIHINLTLGCCLRWIGHFSIQMLDRYCRPPALNLKPQFDYDCDEDHTLSLE